MMDQKHWWEQFCHDNSSNITIRKIINSINDVEQNLNREDLLKIKENINNLNNSLYSEQIKSLEKRYNILENRVERQISDDFGVLLKYLRRKKGFSLAKLSELTGISPSYINRLELKQRKSPSINIMESLANALDVPLSTLTDAAGVELNENKTYPINELFQSHSISLNPQGSEISDLEKNKLISILNIITSNNYSIDDEEELLNRVNSFRDILELNNNNKFKSAK